MNSTESSKRPSGKRPKKRKFTGNMHTRCKAVHSVDESLNNSASGKKRFGCKMLIHLLLNMMTVLMAIECLIKLSCLQTFKTLLLAKNVVVILNYQKNVLEVCLVFSIECKNCKDLCSFRNSKMLGKRKKYSEINRRFVYAMRTIGHCHAAMTTFCGVVDFPPPVAEKSYNNIINKLQLCSKEVAEASMQSAALEEVTLTNSSDIIISGDGTWKTRGYSSCVGVCAVIGDKTGKCIDAEVMSSFCKGCDFWKRRKGSPAYKKWKILHVKECLKNHNGSAGMMETVGMVRIFQHSLSHRSVRYTSYIGDGDSKTFSSITASNPYGEDITVSKIECVGHVQKRMGTRYEKLKQMSSKLSDGKSIGGKGRLTDRMIDLITTYYGNAIRQNKTCLSDMQKAIWAVYFHIRSSDEEPLHSFCPVGPNSWCKYQNQVVEGSVETFRHSNKLPVAVMDAIKPVFNDLSQPKLLQKCLGGKTQNNNESINSLIWKLCPKTLGCGRNIVEISTNEAIVIFNDGNQGRLKIMQSLGLTVGQFAHKFVTLINIKRIQTAEVHFNLCTKEIVRVQYFVRGGFVGHRSRVSSKHLSSHLPVDGVRFLGGQKGVVLQLQVHVWVSGPPKISTAAGSGYVTLLLPPMCVYYLLMEAGCLDWALLIAIILRDAMSVIRVVNSAKQAEQFPNMLKHLKEGMASIEQWAEKECLGYKTFMILVHNQAKALSKMSSPSSSLLKLDMQAPTEDYCSDMLYDNDQNHHRLSTSSDIPGIEGTLVLHGTSLDKEDESSSEKSEDSVDSQRKENQTSDCSIS
ncbi:uncharacterized protein TNCV_3532441 [Trichonephila clavipes]|nr:uncharacterized protein TNCV_3532441 [Trichonephila clavipes]